jgi:prepilin-type N-terminal cleavage/methylation domain-containing protein
MRHKLTCQTRKPLRRPNTESGFTLVEMLVTLVILSIGLLSVGKMFIFSNQHAFYGRCETMAVSLTSEIREKILSDNFDDIKSVFDDVDTNQDGTVNLTCREWADHLEAEMGSSGQGLIQVYDELEDAEITAGMVTIEIEIKWQESGKNRSLKTRFSVSKMGV